MPARKAVRKTRRKTASKKRGGMKLVPYKGRRQGKQAWNGFKKWMTSSAIPWIRSQAPHAHKYVKDNKLISKGIRGFSSSFKDLPLYGNTLLPIAADGVEYMGYGKKRRGAKKIKYKRKKGRGLNRTGGGLNRTGGGLNLTGGMRRRK